MTLIRSFLSSRYISLYMRFYISRLRLLEYIMECCCCFQKKVKSKLCDLYVRNYYSIYLLLIMPYFYWICMFLLSPRGCVNIKFIYKDQSAVVTIRGYSDVNILQNVMYGWSGHQDFDVIWTKITQIRGKFHFELADNLFISHSTVLTNGLNLNYFQRF